MRDPLEWEKLGISTSTRMIASLPYTSAKGVSSVGVLTVACYSHRTLGSSFVGPPFLAVSFVFRIPTRVLLVFLTCPFAWGCPGKEYWAFMPRSLQ